MRVPRRPTDDPVAGGRPEPERCPRCGGALLPVAYGLPGPGMLEAAERGELVLGGCTPRPLRCACGGCGWTPVESDDDDVDWLEEDGDQDDDGTPLTDRHGFDDTPTSAVALTDRTVTEAELLEDRAEALSGLVLLADGIGHALDRPDVADCWRTAANRFAATVRAAADRAAGAADTARHTIGRVLGLLESAADDADDADDDALYEAVLTARLHVPINAELVNDAYRDAIPAVRNLARLALVLATDGPDLPWRAELASWARGVLRLPMPYQPTLMLRTEVIEPWSVTLAELAMEVAGWLATMLLDHRTYIVIEAADRDHRYVQALTYDRGLVVETVADEFLEGDDELTPDDRDNLRSMGWQPPGTDEEAPNWLARFDLPVDLRRVAELLVRTLVEVHGVTGPEDVDVDVADTIDPFGL